MGCEFCREKAEIVDGKVALAADGKTGGKGLKRTNSLMLQRRPSQLSTTKDDREASDEDDILDEKTAERNLTGEIGMSLVSQVKNQEILDLLDTNPDVYYELSEIINNETLSMLIHDLQDVSFTKRHTVDGQKYKANVIKKEDFINLTGEYRDGSISDEAIEAIEPFVALATDMTDFYQIKRLETLLNGVIQKLNEEEDENVQEDY